MNEGEAPDIRSSHDTHSSPITEFPNHSRTGGKSLESAVVSFDRHELREIFNLYGRRVAAGDWKDYAIDFNSAKAVFSIYRRASEVPLFRVEKDPRLARKQGLYAVVTATGLILKRGTDLRRVLQALEPKPKLVVV